MEITRREALKRTGLLLGGALSAPALAGVLAGCQADPAPDWTPRAFSAEQDDLVTTISERIIPATDTPGAEAAQVNRFIDTMLADWYPAGERERFLRGLSGVDARCQETHGKAFLACTPGEQTALLTQLDEEAHAPSGPPAATDPAPDETTDQGSALAAEESEELADEGGGTAAQGRDDRTEEEIDEIERDSSGGAVAGGAETGGEDGPPFFRTMKELTLLGYYTSEIGMGQAQPYNNDIIPGRFIGCVPLEETVGQSGVGGHQNLPEQSV